MAVNWRATLHTYISLVVGLWIGLWDVYRKGHRRGGRHQVSRWLASRAFAPLKVEVEGKLPEGPCLLISGHTCVLDWAFAMIAVPDASFCVGMQPFIKGFPCAITHLLWLFPICVHFFDGQNHVLPLEKGSAGLRDWVDKTPRPWIFPSGLKRKFRTGAFRAAMDLDRVIIPCVLDGARTDFGLAAAKVASPNIKVRLGKPLQPSDFKTVEDLVAAAELACEMHT
mmetsp:Transcript_72366/g.162493  ORF Transcript_72366/g.162493 Transcript_72366/m.162493 type:complete len:225 (+) Transcript_72366:73-747(+)